MGRGASGTEKRVAIEVDGDFGRRSQRLNWVVVADCGESVGWGRFLRFEAESGIPQRFLKTRNDRVGMAGASVLVGGGK